MVTRVPIEPFMQFLDWRTKYHEAFSEFPSRALGLELGWGDDRGAVTRVNRYRRGIKNDGQSGVVPAESWPRATVEDAIDHAGFRFADWYPEVAAAEDLPLEPEQLCWGCEDLVSPIGGKCPWSSLEGHLGHD